MHIVISGYYGFDNVGDEAILFSMIQAMRHERPEVVITVLSNQPELTERTYGVKAVNRWKLKDISKVIKHADGLVSGGGSLLQDETGMRSIPYYTGIIKIAQWHRKPTFVYAQGMGPISKGISKWLTKTVLNKVSQITVRDTLSKQLLVEIGIKQDTILVPDPVLALDASIFTNAWTTQNILKEKFITISVRDWVTTEPFKERIAFALDQLVRAGHDVVFIPMHGERDEKTSQETANLMTEKSYIVPHTLSIEEKISIIGESQLLIGMRLHSIIFAAVNYVPFVALSYDPKIDAFAAICDQPVAGHVSESDWDGESLFKQAKHTLDNLTFQQEAMQQKVKQHQKLARDTPRLVFKTFLK